MCQISSKMHKLHVQHSCGSTLRLTPFFTELFTSHAERFCGCQLILAPLSHRGRIPMHVFLSSFILLHFVVNRIVILGEFGFCARGRPKGLPYIIHYALAHQIAQAVLRWSHSKRALVISLPLGGQLLEQRRQRLQSTPACSDCSERERERERGRERESRGREREGEREWGPLFWHGGTQILVAGWLFGCFGSGHPGQR